MPDRSPANLDRMQKVTRQIIDMVGRTIEAEADWDREVILSSAVANLLAVLQSNFGGLGRAAATSLVLAAAERRSGGSKDTSPIPLWLVDLVAVFLCAHPLDQRDLFAADLLQAATHQAGQHDRAARHSNPPH